MRVVIMGGGKLECNVAHNMFDHKYQVHLIGGEYARCIKITDDLGVEVTYGDGIKLSILEDASTKDADVFTAVTGNGQDNLVAAQLARMEFGAKEVIARANNSCNLEVLWTMGPGTAVSSIGIITNVTEQGIGLSGMHLLATLSKSRAGTHNIALPDDTSLHGVRLMDISLPENTLIVSVMRGGRMIIPNSRSVSHAGDQAAAVYGDKNQKKLLHILGERIH